MEEVGLPPQTQEIEIEETGKGLLEFGNGDYMYIYWD